VVDVEGCGAETAFDLISSSCRHYVPLLLMES
jgi:hypothetical protein